MKNATTIIALALAGFFIVLAVMIGSRLNEQAVSMLAGTACGVGVAIPLGVAIGMYVAGQRRHGRDSVQPPQIVIVPQAQPPSAVECADAAVSLRNSTPSTLQHHRREWIG
jgi:hypothetical protein